MAPGFGGGRRLLQGKVFSPGPGKSLSKMVPAIPESRK